MGLLKHNWIFIVLFFVVLIGSIIRLYRLNEVPLGYTYDETAITYDAWSISLWHRDQFAHFMPLSFESFGDYKPPLLIYLLASIFTLTGLHEVTIRLVAAFSGIGSIIVIYFLATSFFKKEFGKRTSLTGLIAAIVVAFSPWSIQLSRIGFEQNLAFFLGLTGLWLFIKGLSQPRFWLLSSIMLIASMYTFHTAKIFIPLCVLLLGITYRREILRFKKWAGLALLTAIICLSPFIYSSFKLQSNSRANTLILFGNSGEIQSLPQIGIEFFTNIMHQLSPTFWILGWDATSIRHAVPGYGVLLLPMYFIMVPAIAWIILKNRNRIAVFLLCLWVAGLMPALLSHTTPHVIRSQFTLIATAMIIALGLTYFLDWLIIRQKKMSLTITSVILIITFLFQFFAYLSTYFDSYAITSAPEFQYGYREAVLEINRLKQDDETIFITSNYRQPYIYLLLYNRITPQEFLFGGLNQYKISPIYWDGSHEKGLYLATPDEIPPNDPRAIHVLTVPGSQQPVLVIARNP